MDLKRHHVLYVFLALSLILGLLFFFAPRTPAVSDRVSETSSNTAPTSLSATQTGSSTLQAVRFEVVTTQAAQEQGLGGRPDIPENYAMLFVFPQDGKIGFWMKDMLAPIDMIWVSDAGNIIGIEDSVAPDTYPQVFYPPAPVKYVLETRAGEARRRGWAIGTHVDLPLPYGK